MACERKLIESEATTGFFVLLGTKEKKETLEWCMKANLIASRYEYPRFKKICVCKNERERLTATNGVAATSRKIIATTLFECEKGHWFSESKLAIIIILRLTRYWFGKSMNAFVVNDLKVNKNRSQVGG
ncbi:hypothetical protein TNCV_793961 [Trichonephila clavipes]|nr:hypothetical protein TNCV_793961 [Trichonephila clavipes]